MHSPGMAPASGLEIRKERLENTFDVLRRDSFQEWQQVIHRVDATDVSITRYFFVECPWVGDVHGIASDGQFHGAEPAT